MLTVIAIIMLVFIAGIITTGLTVAKLASSDKALDMVNKFSSKEKRWY